MSNDEPVKLETKAEVPLKVELVALLTTMQDLYGKAAGTLTFLESRLAEGFAPKDQPTVSDAELAFHALALEQLGNILPEITKQINRCKEMNAFRFRDAMKAEDSLEPSEGMIMYRHSFVLEEDVGPLIPNVNKEPEKHQAFMNWLRTSPYSDSLFEKVHFSTVKDILNDCLTQGQPLPPGLGMFSKPKIKVKATR